MTATATKTTGSYNFPSSFPTEDEMETLQKIMNEVEAIFENSLMNTKQKISGGGCSSGITFGSSYEGGEDCFEVWRNYVFHNNHIDGFQIPDFHFQVSSKGNYSGWVPSPEYEMRIWKVLEKYKKGN